MSNYTSNTSDLLQSYSRYPNVVVAILFFYELKCFKCNWNLSPVKFQNVTWFILTTYHTKTLLYNILHSFYCIELSRVSYRFFYFFCTFNIPKFYFTSFPLWSFFKKQFVTVEQNKLLTFSSTPFNFRLNGYTFHHSWAHPREINFGQDDPESKLEGRAIKKKITSLCHRDKRSFHFKPSGSSRVRFIKSLTTDWLTSGHYRRIFSLSLSLSLIFTYAMWHSIHAYRGRAHTLYTTSTQKTRGVSSTIGSKT